MTGKDDSEIKRLSALLNLENAEVCFDNCWRTIEDYLIIFAAGKTDSKYGMKILELQEYKQNKNHPERVRWFINVSQ